MQRIGKVEWYSQKRGFGIISSRGDDGAIEKFFVHVTKIVRSPEIIEYGQQAAFTVGLPPRKEGELPNAVNVTITVSLPPRKEGEPTTQASKAVLQ